MPGIRNVRKRPAIAVSDDDEQSDASYGSGMSKRARHDRDAPDNPAPTNGYRQRPDDDDDDRIYEEGVYQPGSIVRVKLTNFVTYTAVEFHLGPSLNMIIGPNGTGKSTLVCAICLGLGWSPQHLGRAKDIGEFVKHGHSEAEIEIELAAHKNIAPNPVIRRVIRKEGNKSAFFIDGRPVPQKEATALAKSFDIQIDNLCQFLPQDRVVEFARLDPVSLLRETLRAAAPLRMVEWHDQLKELRSEEKSLEVKIQNEGNHLKALQAKQNATREDVERFNQRQELITKSENLAKCRPIIRMRILNAEVKQIKANLRAIKQELERYKADSQPARQAQVEMEQYRDSVEQVAKRRKERFNSDKGTVEKIGLEIDKVQQLLAGCSADIEAEKHAEKQRRLDIKRMEAEIKRLRHVMTDNPVEYDPTMFDTQKAEIRARKSAADRRVGDLGTDLATIRSRVVALGEQIKMKNQEREQLNTQSGQKANLLKKLSSDSAKAWEWLEKNMSTLGLQDTVYPPPLLSCSVSDSRYAAAVESQLRNRSDWTAFTCTNTRDVKIISDKLLGRQDNGGLGLHQITIRCAPQPRAFYRSPLTHQELTQLGFDGWISDYVEGPDPVLSMLCESTKLHRAAFASRTISNDQYSALQRAQINKWVSGKEVYQITTRREYGASSTSVTQLKPAQYFTDQPVATDEKRILDQQIQQFRMDAQQLKEDYQKVAETLKKAKEEQTKAEEERKQINEEQEKLRRAYAEWQDLPRKIANKEAELEGIQSQSAETYDRIKQIRAKSEKASLKAASLTLDYAKAVTQLRVLHESYVEAEIRFVEAVSEVKGFETENASILRNIEQKQAEINHLEQQRKEKTAQHGGLLKTAQRLIRDLTESEKEMVKEFSELPSLEALENEITAVHARLELMAEGNPDAIRAFENREQRIHAVQESLEKVGEQLGETQERIKEIRGRWEPELDHLVSKISEEFSNNFQQIGCAGQVGVGKDEDFENWSIQIQVRFRENEALSILDSHRQSGGERAVSTIFYLMALQELARSPFRVVDEINQGMDPRNERMVHERMVDIACREHTSQYFLITPKLLTGLKFHPKMKVHCIASGEHMPDQRANLNFQTLANMALRVKLGKSMIAAA